LLILTVWVADLHVSILRVAQFF